MFASGTHTAISFSIRASDQPYDDDTFRVPPLAVVALPVLLVRGLRTLPPPRPFLVFDSSCACASCPWACVVVLIDSSEGMQSGWFGLVRSLLGIQIYHGCHKTFRFHSEYVFVPTGITDVLCYWDI